MCPCQIKKIPLQDCYNNLSERRITFAQRGACWLNAKKIIFLIRAAFTNNLANNTAVLYRVKSFRMCLQKTINSKLRRSSRRDAFQDPSGCRGSGCSRARSPRAYRSTYPAAPRARHGNTRPTARMARRYVCNAQTVSSSSIPSKTSTTISPSSTRTIPPGCGRTWAMRKSRLTGKVTPQLPSGLSRA